MHKLQTALQALCNQFTSTQSRPSLCPIPGTKPLTLQAALLPPLLYYIALLLLPPSPPPLLAHPFIIVLRTALALSASFFFFRLPLAYHVPQSIGLTYQLGLVGLYGGLRVLDAFFISAWWFNHIPRRVTYFHNRRPETPSAERTQPVRAKEWTDGGVKDPYHHDERSNYQLQPTGNSPTPVSTTARSPMTRSKSREVAKSASDGGGVELPATSRAISNGSLVNPCQDSPTTETASHIVHRTLTGPAPIPVYETARTDPDWPHTFLDRASWALELELSMRGQGFTWTTADVRHTRKTWLPTIRNRVHSILVHVLPVQIGAWCVISGVYSRYLAETLERQDYNSWWRTEQSSVLYRIHRQGELFDTLPVYVQLMLTVALGAFLMSAFSLGHSIFAIMLHPLSPSPLAFFPPLYTTRVWSLTSVRAFWSFGWHRLFARLFLVWGVWPGEWLERTVMGKGKNEPADVGKVVGAFASSAFVHAFSVRGVLAGSWKDAGGEMRFFLLNGMAVVIEGAVVMAVKRVRRRAGWREKTWYDAWIGRVWWISTVAWSGREFARGWVKSGLVREMAFR